MIAESSYASRLLKAVQIDRPRESVDQIKSAVASEMRALDPKMRLESTGYFNHSYVPDFVATWPTDPTVTERYVYLKANSQLSYLREDLGLVQDQHPIIFGLGITPSGQDEVAQLIADESREHDTLVTDATGMERFIGTQSAPSGNFVRLVARSITQGGRGLLDDHAAGAASRAIEDGYEGARLIDSEQTRRGTSVINDVLSHRHAARLTHLLQAVWVGSGGQIYNFPGGRNIASDVSDEALQFLIDFEDIDHFDFWRRVGSGISVSQLSRLRVSIGKSNLDRLIQANYDRLWARSCQIVDEQQQLDGMGLPGALHWSIDRGLLSLRSPDFTAYVAERADELNVLPKRESRGIAFSALIERASDIVFDGLELSVERRTVTYSSEDRANIARDSRLAALVSSLGDEVLAKRIIVALPESRHIACDFGSGTATGRTANKIPLTELLSIAIPLLRRLEDADREALRAKLASVGDFGSWDYFFRQGDSAE